jgi:DNA-binding NarL/FixJ family response regulator
MSEELIRIGVVEDAARIRANLAAFFRSEPGCLLVGEYANAEEALEGLPAAAPDVVVMDIGLPGISGIECVRRLAPAMPGTQFLMFTLHDDDAAVFEALKAGANGYLVKSSTPDEIIHAVRELREGGSPMSMGVARRVIDHFRGAPRTPDAAALGITEREAQLLSMLAEGLLYKEIADRTGLTVGTIKQHIHRLYGKLHVANRTEAVNRFLGR